jgi:hypothetical protein
MLDKINYWNYNLEKIKNYRVCAMVKFESTLSNERSKELNQFAFKRLWWLMLLCSLLFILFGVLAVMQPDDPVDKSVGIILIVFGIGYAPIVWLVTRLRQKRYDRSMSIMSDETHEVYTFDEHHFTISQVKGLEYEANIDAAYTYFYKVIKTDDAYLFYVSMGHTHIVPRSTMTEGTTEELDALLSSRMGDKFKIKCKH